MKSRSPDSHKLSAPRREIDHDLAALRARGVLTSPAALATAAGVSSAVAVAAQRDGRGITGLVATAKCASIQAEFRRRAAAVQAK